MINNDSVQEYFLTKLGDCRLTRHFEDARGVYPEKIEFLSKAFDLSDVLEKRLNTIEQSIIKGELINNSMFDHLTEMNLIEQRQTKVKALIKMERSDIDNYLTHKKLY